MKLETSKALTFREAGISSFIYLKYKQIFAFYVYFVYFCTCVYGKIIEGIFS